MKTLKSNEMAVYVGTYAKYNNGSLKGEWVYLSEFDCKDDFIDYCIDELHADEDEPELMFQDWENIPAGLITENSIKEEVWDVLEALDELDADEQVIYLKWLDWTDSDNVSADDFRECYCGDFSDRFDPLTDYAQELYDEGVIDADYVIEHNYIDFEGIGRDLRLNGDVYEIDGHIFSN